MSRKKVVIKTASDFEEAAESMIPGPPSKKWTRIIVDTAPHQRSVEEIRNSLIGALQKVRADLDVLEAKIRRVF